MTNSDPAIWKESIYTFEHWNGLESIGNGAFRECSGLASLTLPSSLKIIGEEVFVYCSNLNSINVHADNQYYKSQGDCLLTKDGKVLLYGFSISIIPDTVEVIGYRAFLCCEFLYSITIPDSVKYIQEEAFDCCDNLNEIICEANLELPYLLSGNNGVWQLDGFEVSQIDANTTGTYIFVTGGGGGGEPEE